VNYQDRNLRSKVEMPEQVLEPRMRAETVESRVHIEENYLPQTLFRIMLQQIESLLFLADSQ